MAETPKDIEVKVTPVIEQAVLGTIEQTEEQDWYVSISAGSPAALIELLKSLGWTGPAITEEN